MTGRYRVSLGNVQMDTLNDSLLILDVAYSPVDMQDRQYTTANLDGYDVSSTYYGQQAVTVTFELHIYDVAKRNAACQKVNEWAMSSKIMRTNDRADQYISVSCKQFASIESARNWTDPLTLVFVTDYIPFWCSNTAKTLTVDGKNARGSLKLDGNISDALVNVTATAKATVKSFQVTVGNYKLKVTGITVANGQTIVIDYIRNRYLRIRANGASVMSKLDPASSDNLKAACGGTTAVSVVADGNISTVFTARGLWV